MTKKKKTKALNLKCPQCGNEDLEEMQQCIEMPTYLFRNLSLEEDGTVYAGEDIVDVVDGSESTSESIYCQKCGEHFAAPGIQSS